MDSQTLLNLVIILSLTPLALIIVIAFMYSKIKSQVITIADLRIKMSQNEDKEKEFMKFHIGSKALLNNYGLTHTDSKTGTKTSFSVDYEVEIVDISEEQLKVKALSFSANDSWSRDPNHRQGIINFMQDRWVSKKDAQLILDESYNRQVKLEQLGL